MFSSRKSVLFGMEKIFSDLKQNLKPVMVKKLMLLSPFIYLAMLKILKAFPLVLLT